MTSSNNRFTLVALACMWLGTAGCDQWPFNAVDLDPSQSQSGTGAGGKTGDTTPPKPTTPPETKGDTAGAAGCDKPQPPAPDTGNCKPAFDSKGLPCKICVDAAGKIYDDCGGSTAGGAGSDGTTTAPEKCAVMTDPKTGATCKTCWAPDGTVTASDCSDTSGTAGSGGTTPVPVKCDAVTDPKTGTVCKTCWEADGVVTATDCTTVPAPGTSASCTASKDPTTGQPCKVCSDETGKITFTDCSGYGG